MTDQDLLAVFKDTGALLEGHFQLTSGLHSDRYFQCAKVLQYPRHTEHLCGILAARFAARASTWSWRRHSGASSWDRRWGAK